MTQRVLTHPTLSLAARGLYAVVSALREDPAGAQAVLDATPKDVLRPLLAELIDAGYAWRNSNGGFTLSDLGPRDEPVITLHRPKLNQSGWAYAISDSDRRLVKIGMSADVPRRLRGLQTSSPRKLEVLWQREGGAALEAHLHEAFADQRVRGEWFDFAGADPVAAIAEAASFFGSSEADG